MAFQLAQDILTGAAPVHKADKGGAQLAVGDVLRHVPAHAAMDLLHPAHIASGGNECCLREALDVHKHRTDDHNTHVTSLLSVSCIPL